VAFIPFKTAAYQNLFDVIIDQNRNFTIETCFETHYNIKLLRKVKRMFNFFEYQKAVVSQQNLAPFIETSPNSLLSKYVKALHFPITETFFR
jgi:hypothetical protein